MEAVYRVKIENEKVQQKETESLKILKEITGKLYNRKDKLTNSNYRIIHAKQKKKLWDKRQETSLREYCKTSFA